MKTTATLFAAILIAMAGVMPALAEEHDTNVVLTVEVVPLIRINVSPSLLVFGQVLQGDFVFEEVEVTNEGTVKIDLSVSLTVETTPGFYADNLELTVDLDTYTVDNFGMTMLDDETATVVLGLNVPIDAPTGLHEGTLVFWAETHAHAQPSISPTIGMPTTFFTIIDPQGRLTVANRIIVTPEGESPELGLEVTDAWFSADGKTATGKIPPTAQIGQNYITVHAGPASDPPLFNALDFTVSA